MVHQHFKLVPDFTVAQNVVLGPGRAAGLLQPRLQDQRRPARRALDPLRPRGGPRRDRRGPAGGEQQRVEILRALLRDASDPAPRRADGRAHPAGVAAPVPRPPRAHGGAAVVVFISHKLDEVLAVADRVTVLRRGKKVDTVQTEGATERSLATLMVGPRRAAARREVRPLPPGEPLLEVRDLHVNDDRGLPAVNGLSLTVRAGEIVGLAGVDANGQSQLVNVIRRAAPHRVRGPSSSTGATSPGHGGLRRHRGRRRAHRRGSSPSAVSSWSSTWPRTCRCSSTASPRCARWACCRRVAWTSARPSCCSDYDIRGGDVHTPALVAVGRQPAEVRDRARAGRRPEGAARGAADARPGRRRHRVRAPPAGRGARQGPRHPADLARARGDPLAERPPPGDLRGRDRGRAATGGLGGGVRRRDDRRRAPGGQA